MNNKDENVKIKIKNANKDVNADINIECRGNITIKDDNGDTLILTNVLYTNHVAHNLFSMRKLVNSGINVTIDDDTIKLKCKKTGKTIKTGKFDIKNSKSDERTKVYKKVNSPLLRKEGINYSETENETKNKNG